MCSAEWKSCWASGAFPTSTVEARGAGPRSYSFTLAPLIGVTGSMNFQDRAASK